MRSRATGANYYVARSPPFPGRPCPRRPLFFGAGDETAAAGLPLISPGDASPARFPPGQRLHPGGG